jgi:ferredoxin
MTTAETRQEGFVARIAPAGPAFAVPYGQTVLGAAAQAGIIWPSSCRNGTCRACITQLLDGSVHYRIDWPGLLPEEKAAGMVLPCVAYASSDLMLAPPGT